jgi:hypothetical protein
MKRYIKYFSIIISLAVVCAYTVSDYKPIKQVINVKATSFNTDNLGNAYLVNDNILTKYDTSGVLLSTYSERSLGRLSVIDASNPMRPLVFYPDFGQVNILDNKLAPQSSVMLRDIKGIEQPTLICQSYNDCIWVFDQQDFQLKRINTSLQTLNESGNINKTVDTDITPNYLTENNNWVYLNNPQTGILVFDIYGTYYKTIPIKGLKSIQLIGDELLYMKDSTFVSYNIKSFNEQKILLPKTKKVINARIVQHKLFLLTEESLDLYSF